MRLFVLLLLFAPAVAHAQFEMQESHTTASLRGIHAVSPEVAWASGTNGTVLKTEDGGKNWKPCAVPAGAEKLDFRGIQAFDATTAIVMSSGTGELSRIYKTVDGCATWTLVFTNPDKNGFFDAIQFAGRNRGFVIGDPIKDPYESTHPEVKQDILPFFPLISTMDGGSTWRVMPVVYQHLWNPEPGQSLFAASNSSALFLPLIPEVLFVTGGPKSYLWSYRTPGPSLTFACGGAGCDSLQQSSSGLASGESAGGFSIASNSAGRLPRLVLVGGDYKRPNASAGTAASCVHSPERQAKASFPEKGSYVCTAAETLPHGYRSAVAYDSRSRRWITVGPTGTEVSQDDGRNWRPLRPGKLDKPDADVNWNALSLPFVVGPKGRIGKLRPDALK